MFSSKTVKMNVSNQNFDKNLPSGEIAQSNEDKTACLWCVIFSFTAEIEKQLNFCLKAQQTQHL